MRKAPCISPPRPRCKKPLTNPGGVRVVIISLAPALQQGGIFEMTDKTFDTISPRGDRTGQQIDSRRTSLRHRYAESELVWRRSRQMPAKGRGEGNLRRCRNAVYPAFVCLVPAGHPGRCSEEVQIMTTPHGFGCAGLSVCNFLCVSQFVRSSAPGHCPGFAAICCNLRRVAAICSKLRRVAASCHGDSPDSTVTHGESR